MASTQNSDLVHEDRVQKALEKMKTELDRLDPNAKTTDKTGWQERKSASTRLALLNATMNCLAEFGYANTTTQLVAATAQISRGAMLHHYNSKSELISATIDFIMYQRMENFYSQIAKLTKKQRVDQGQGVEIFWNSMSEPQFEAYLELSVASRTDMELDKVFTKRARAFDQFCFDRTTEFFPEWDDQTLEKQWLAQDIIACALEGLFLRKSIMNTRTRRIAVRDYIKQMVRLLRT